MSERLHHNETAPQPSAELERLAAERLRSLEQSGEQVENKQEAVEAAQEQLRRVEVAAPAAETTPTAEPVNRSPLLTRAANYRQTMVSLQHRMKPAARSFSKFIHKPVVENTSELLGKTVMRPSVSLGATTTAVIVTGFVYLYARSQGFILKDSIVWLSLLLGAIIGLVIEALYRLVKRR